MPSTGYAGKKYLLNEFNIYGSCFKSCLKNLDKVMERQ